ncbi:hypothetical protein KCP69_06705 [Salmonella enterica subsp. enterica]|nr:hypothetical protein KCP69_06705 [Salmonella enterica subsp. enterica]
MSLTCNASIVFGAWQPDGDAGRCCDYTAPGGGGGSLPRPQAIVVVSARWYTRGTGVTASRKPNLHDFASVCRANVIIRPFSPTPAGAGAPAELLAPVPAAPMQQKVTPTTAPGRIDQDVPWNLISHGSFSAMGTKPRALP